MKRILCILISIITILSLTVLCFAHSGRTDANGGHFDHSTGEYHYHNGNSNHGTIENDNGTDRNYFYDNSQYNKEETTCFYEKDDIADKFDEDSTDTKNYKNDSDNKLDLFDYITKLAISATISFMITPIILVIYEFLYQRIKKQVLYSDAQDKFLKIVFVILLIITFYFQLQ